MRVVASQGRGRCPTAEGAAGHLRPWNPIALRRRCSARTERGVPDHRAGVAGNGPKGVIGPAGNGTVEQCAGEQGHPGRGQAAAGAGPPGMGGVRRPAPDLVEQTNAVRRRPAPTPAIPEWTSTPRGVLFSVFR